MKRQNENHKQHADTCCHSEFVEAHVFSGMNFQVSIRIPNKIRQNAEIWSQVMLYFVTRNKEPPIIFGARINLRRIHRRQKMAGVPDGLLD